MKETIRLDKLLGHAGWGTRKEIKELCKKGYVTVNGSGCRNISQKLDPKADVISVKGEVVTYEENLYLMMNKPAGVLSATEDFHGTTVIDLIDKKDGKNRIFPVGRLDKDTTGLLLLTNDGQWSHSITHPKKHMDKVYYAAVEGVIPPDIDTLFQKGIVLDDGLHCLPARCRITGPAELAITVQEGKFHQVKRMCKAVGLTVKRLYRHSIGGLVLDEALSPGSYRRLTEEERERVHHSISQR